MNENQIIFNGLKHHLKYIVEKINNINTYNDFQVFLKEITEIGHSETDIYTGNLNYFEIISCVYNFLKANNIVSYSDYINFIRSDGHDYKVIQLYDGSCWILRIGKKFEDKFVHIHPARFSEYTIRINSLSLKTSLIFLIKRNLDKIEFNIEEVNNIRVKYFGISPIKKINSNSNIIKALKLLHYN
jgi:hypothetical protein